MGFTDLLSRLPSGKALPISHYDDEFVVASIDKIQNILLNKQYSENVTVNTVDRPTVAVKTNSPITTILAGNENSSDVIGQNRLNSSLALLNLKIIAAIISCIARSIKIFTIIILGQKIVLQIVNLSIIRNLILKVLPLRTKSCYIFY